MGYDATNVLPQDTKLKDVGDFLRLLGFERAVVEWYGGTKHIVYWHYDPNDYERFQGLSASVSRRDDGEVSVHTRTLISRNKADCDLHNDTMRQLRKRFGGYFVSDEGRGRYFQWSGTALTGAEAGCYLAYWRLHNNTGRVFTYLWNRQFRHSCPMMEMADQDPVRISNNLLAPLLVSLIEDYLRSTFRALLRHSPKRAEFLKKHRISAAELIADDGSQLLVEDVVLSRMSFQNLGTVQSAFKALNPKIDVAGQLKKPYRRRRESLYESMSLMIAIRHALIHRAELDPTLTEDRLERLVQDMTVAMKRVYEHLIAVHGWHPNDQD